MSIVPTLPDMASPKQDSYWPGGTFSNPRTFKQDVKTRSLLCLRSLAGGTLPWRHRQPEVNPQIKAGGGGTSLEFLCEAGEGSHEAHWPSASPTVQTAGQ